MHEASAAGEQPFAFAFDHAPLAMAVVAPDGWVLQANAALSALVGPAPEELRTLRLATLVHPDDAEAEAASRRALLAGGPGADTRELRLRHRRGRTVWARLTRTLARSPAGEPLYFVDQLQDLTELRRGEKEIVLLNNLLEQRLRRRTEELDESADDLREFAQALAHDLRGPLGSIDGFSAQLEASLSAAPLDARSAHCLARIRSGVRTLSELTDALLALTEVSRSEVVRDAVDLSQVASRTLHRLRRQQPARRAVIRVEDTPPAFGDPHLLPTVVENLVANAWKFTQHCEIAQIRFGAEPSAAGVRYFVRDNGIGFDPAYADKMFVPFQRLHTQPEFKGTGIGLALVRKILARHGGRVWAESQPGTGTCFYFQVSQPTPPPAPDTSY